MTPESSSVSDNRGDGCWSRCHRRRVWDRFTAVIPTQAISIAAIPEVPPPVVPRQIAVIGMPSPIEVKAMLCAGLHGAAVLVGCWVRGVVSEVFTAATLVPALRFMSSTGVARQCPSTTWVRQTWRQSSTVQAQ